MSTSDSIVSSQTKQSSWRKSDTTWTLGLFGTAIGAGVLFFPIRAGFGGLIPILLMLVLAYPIAFYCHRALARLCLSGSNPSGNITETVEEHFGKTGRRGYHVPVLLRDLPTAVDLWRYYYQYLYDVLGKPARICTAESRLCGAVPVAADGFRHLVW